MRGSFFGLDIAVRGLYTAQRNLDIVNHNLNNINTPGFSKQQAVQVAAPPVSVYDGTGMVGTGSEVVAVNRARDEYLDYKYWSEAVSFGEWDTKRALLADIEATFNEPSENGFNKVLDEFFASLQELSKDPGSGATRALVREKGVTLAKYFNSIAAHFEKIQGDVNYSIKTKVEEINSIATQIRQLNRQIYISELDGNTANDLRDQRGVLVDRLSRLVNIQVNEIVTGKLPNGKDDKHFIITISGKALVDHFNITKLSVTQRKNKLNPGEDIENLYEVGWEDGNSLDVKGGELRGYLDIRDGNEGENGSPAYKGIPYYVKKLNEFVRTLAKAFNEGIIGGVKNTGHADGFGLDPDGDGPQTSPAGMRFFTMLGDDGRPFDSTTFINGAATVSDISSRYNNITAKNFAVSADVMTDINSISTSDTTGTRDNTVVLNALLEMRHDPHMFMEGAPEDFMKSLVSNLGIDSQQAVRFSDSQDAIVKQIDKNRMSVSGVSIDEEMANLVKFQHAYNASAKMIATLAEVYDTLINRLGV